MNRLRLIRAGLLAMAILMGVVIAWRLLFGPFQNFFFSVKAPLNPEGIFGLSITLLLLTAERKPPKQPVQILTRRTMTLLVSAVVLITLAGLARALRIYFLSDDFNLLKALAGWTARNYVRAFWIPTEYAFLRPVGYLFVGLSATWFPNPAARHAGLLLLHACNAILVVFVARRMGATPIAAGFAATLFGIHGTQSEGAVWIGSTFGPLSTWFVLVGFLLLAKARERLGGMRYTLLACAAVSSILAMLSKEAAFIFPLLVLIYAISKRDSLRSTVPFFAIAALVFAYRWIVLGGVGGYVLDGGRPLAVSLGLATTLKAVVVRLWAFLYFPINWSADPSLLLSLLGLSYIAFIIWLAVRTTPTVPLWPAAAAILVSIIPPLAILSGSATLAGSRVLDLASVWFCILLALAIDGLSGSWKRFAFEVILLFHVAALQHNLDSWEYASAKVKTACDFAARISQSSPKLILIGNPPGEIRGTQGLKNGFKECVEFSAQRPLDLEVLPDWPAARGNAAYLVWDEGTDQLKLMNPPGTP